MAVSEPDWAALLSREYVEAPECWQRCGGGHCCDPKLPEGSFRLIRSTGVTLFYMEREFAFLAARGEVPGFGEPGIRRLALDLGNGRALSAITVQCGLLGRCDGVRRRPLHCRTYPFAPVFHGDGGVADVVPMSVFDVAQAGNEGRSNCAIAPERDWAAFWRGFDPAGLDLLRHPYIAFHLGAAAILMDSYGKQLAGEERLAGKAGAAFWRSWEVLYLSGQLLDLDTVRRRICELHDRMVARFGDFNALVALEPHE